MVHPVVKWNAYAERWVQSLRAECPDHFVAVGERRRSSRTIVPCASTTTPSTLVPPMSRPMVRPAAPSAIVDIDAADACRRLRLGPHLLVDERVGGIQQQLAQSTLSLVTTLVLGFIAIVTALLIGLG